MQYLAAVLPAGLGILFILGCAGRPAAPSTTHDAIVQQAKERQRALDLAEEPDGRTTIGLTAADYERLGDQYIRQGNQTLAFVQYQRSLRQQPDQSRVRHKLGLLYVRRGLWQEAEAEFQRILRDDAAYASAYEGLGYVNLSRGRVPEAEDSFRQAIALNPRSWKALAFLGLLDEAAGRHTEAAGKLQAALALKPAHRALRNNLARVYYAMGRYDDAIEQFRQALRDAPSDPQLSNNLGLALAKARRYQEAFNAFRTGGDLQKAYNNLGVMYWATGNHHEAIACFQRAIEIGHEPHPSAASNLAAIRANLGGQPTMPVTAVASPCHSQPRRSP